MATVNAVRPYVETLLMIVGSSLLGQLVSSRWGPSAVDLVYLPAVLAAAGLYGLGPGVVAAVASALAFNYLFTQPLHTFRITSPTDVVTVALLFLVALVTSRLASQMRAQALAAKSSAARNATIAGLARRLLSCSSDEQIATITCRELARLFDCNAVMLSGMKTPEPIGDGSGAITMTPSDLIAAEWAIESGKPTGRGTRSVEAAEWYFYPIRSASTSIGAIGLARNDGIRPVPAMQIDLLDNLVDQVALALERARLERDALEFARVREADRTRSVLLSSIGQDIEPRLSMIAGAVRALRRSDLTDKSLVSEIGPR